MGRTLGNRPPVTRDTTRQETGSRTGLSVGAAIDIGSNSVHLLVALVGNGWTETLRDRSELLGLGDVLQNEDELPADSRERVVTTLQAYAEMARQSRAERLTIIGTDPLRRAANAHELAHEVERAVGVPVRVLSEHEEALLTYLGVTRGMRQEGPLMVVDIGGGSTEVATSQGSGPLSVTSIRIGSARLTNAIVEHDPPTSDEIDRLVEAAAAAIKGLPMPASRPRAIFVGGTATNVARLGRLTKSGLEADRRTLATLPAAAVSARFNVRPRRARQLPAGVAIVEALLAHYALDAAEVSEASLRDGAIIAAARYGDEWPDHLEEMTSDL